MAEIDFNLTPVQDKLSWISSVWYAGRHFEQAINSCTFQGRIYHLAMASLDLLPIIGRIISYVEKFFLDKKSEAKLPNKLTIKKDFRNKKDFRKEKPIVEYFNKKKPLKKKEEKLDEPKKDANTTTLPKLQTKPFSLPLELIKHTITFATWEDRKELTLINKDFVKGIEQLHAQDKNKLILSIHDSLRCIDQEKYKNEIEQLNHFIKNLKKPYYDMKSKQDFILRKIFELFEKYSKEDINLLKSRDIALSLYRFGGLTNIPVHFRNDREYMWAVCMYNNAALHDASDALKNDKDLVTAAICDQERESATWLFVIFLML